MTQHILLLALMLLATFGLTTSCPGHSQQVVLVFPDGYKGIAVVRAKRQDGATIKATGDVITFTFPSSGILDINGELPTLKWHILSAKYASGDLIPVYNPQNQVSDDTVALRSIGVLEDTEDWYVIGTVDDAKKALHKKWGYKDPADDEH